MEKKVRNLRCDFGLWKEVVAVLFVKIKALVLNVETVIVYGHVGPCKPCSLFPLNKAKASSLMRLWRVRPKGFHGDNLCRQSWLRRCPRPINDPQLFLYVAQLGIRGFNLNYYSFAAKAYGFKTVHWSQSTPGLRGEKFLSFSTFFIQILKRKNIKINQKSEVTFQLRKRK